MAATLSDKLEALRVKLSHGKTPAELWPFVKMLGIPEVDATAILGSREAAGPAPVRAAVVQRTVQPKAVQRSTCRHLMGETGRTTDCPSCRGMVKVKLLACDVFSICTVAKPIQDVVCCATCAKWEAR